MIFSGSSNRRYVTGVVLDIDWKAKVVEVIRNSDRLIMAKLVIETVVLNVISTYAPQVGLDEGKKVNFGRI